MTFQSLRDYIETIQERGLVSKVDDADWNLEIGALTEIVAFSSSPKCLVFDNIRGYQTGFRIATNLYVSERLQAIALNLPDDQSGIKLVQKWRDRIRKLSAISPKIVPNGPILENILVGDDIDVLKTFPIPMWHRYDGGRYMGTGDAVITSDPEEGWTNAGTYRCMVHDGKTLGLLIEANHHGGIMLKKYWAQGKDAPIVITFGQEPSLYAAACAPLEWGRSELDYACAIRGEPIELIRDEKTGLPIPAQAEIAIVGHVPPPRIESKDEGPFGECTGYYTSHGPAPVVHIDKLMFRDQPILQGSPPMYGSTLTTSLGGKIATSAAVWDNIEKQVQNVVGVYSLYQPCQSGSTILVVAIRQAFPGHAKQVAHAALASRAAIITNRMVIVVDEDIDPSNRNEVLFAMTSRCSPAEDVTIVDGIGGWALDPTISKSKREVRDFTTSTMIFDATRKPFGRRNEFPRTNILEADLRDAVRAKWASLIGDLAPSN